MQKQIKILYFIKDAVATPADMLAASKIAGAQVCFRNATYVETVEEHCDGVAGEVPECYEDFPTAAQAVAKQEKALHEMQKKFGETKAPKKQAKPDSEKALGAAIERNADAGKAPAWNPNPNAPA